MLPNHSPSQRSFKTLQLLLSWKPVFSQKYCPSALERAPHDGKTRFSLLFLNQTYVARHVREISAVWVLDMHRFYFPFFKHKCLLFQRELPKKKRKEVFCILFYRVIRSLPFCHTAAKQTILSLEFHKITAHLFHR